MQIIHNAGLHLVLQIAIANSLWNVIELFPLKLYLHLLGHFAPRRKDSEYVTNTRSGPIQKPNEVSICIDLIASPLHLKSVLCGILDALAIANFCKACTWLAFRG